MYEVAHASSLVMMRIEQIPNTSDMSEDAHVTSKPAMASLNLSSMPVFTPT
jgi:hypothetical protein